MNLTLSRATKSRIRGVRTPRRADGTTYIRVSLALTIRSGATHLVVHHPRKSEEDTDHPILRGSGALDGRADVVMTMYRDRKFLPKTGEKADYMALSTDDHGGKNRSAATETIQGLYLSEQLQCGVPSGLIGVSV